MFYKRLNLTSPEFPFVWVKLYFQTLNYFIKISNSFEVKDKDTV